MTELNDKSIICKNCGMVMKEDSSDSFENRVPCPSCGSKLRHFTLSVQSGVYSITGGAVTFTLNKNTPNLLLQTIFQEGKKTNEGLIIEAVTLPWFDIIKLFEEEPNTIYQISPRKWEEIIAGAYKKAGYDEVILTPQSNDFGRDVIATKKGVGTIRVIDQVKAYQPGHLVKAKDVRELVGVLEWDKASKGFLTTTSDFAPNLKSGKDPITKFIPSRIELINGDTLIKKLIELSKK